MDDAFKIVTRFAPSPTGPFHVGSARTALFNFLATKHYGGRMILRIEDTDRERSKGEYEEEIIEGLRWLGISYDETLRQSERGNIYKKHIEKLLADGAAYEAKGKEGEAVRFKNTNKNITFTDIVRGEITFNTEELGDFVVARSKTEPLYHLAAVIDDFESGVTHVIRGEDHISNTPRQILIQEALSAPRPEYVHIPLVLAPDRSKLSKRHLSALGLGGQAGGATSVGEYREEGYLPEALVNFLALLGWSPAEENKEIFTLGELAEQFSFDRIQKGGAVFNAKKLHWINREHIKRLSPEVLREKVAEFIPENVKSRPQYSAERLARATPALVERLDTFGELKGIFQGGGEMEYIFSAPSYPKPLDIPWKNGAPDEAVQHLEQCVKFLKDVPEDNFTESGTKEALWQYAEEKGRGNVLWPMRYALSGRDKSPDPFMLAEIFGKKETIARIEKAREALVN